MMDAEKQSAALEGGVIGSDDDEDVKPHAAVFEENRQDVAGRGGDSSNGKRSDDSNPFSMLSSSLRSS